MLFVEPSAIGIPGVRGLAEWGPIAEVQHSIPVVVLSTQHISAIKFPNHIFQRLKSLKNIKFELISSQNLKEILEIPRISDF